MSCIDKDYAKLKEISECFTEETLQNILYTVYNGKEINILSWKLAEASAKGDNYLSDVNKIKITGTIDEKEVEVNLVVKSLPKNIGRRNTYRSPEFFHNENAFYTKIIPEFQKFLTEKCQTQVLCIPRYFGSIIDGENDYIALQDVTVLGYKPIARQNCLTEDQCIMILKAIAKFHAISFAFKNQKKEKFMEIVTYLNETYFSIKHWQWYKRFFETIVDIAKNALAIEYPDSKAEKKFNSYKVEELFQKAVKLCDRKYESTSVIIQGDSWVPNYLVQQTKNEALMLDFQLARCASPILDISTCIYACTDKALWNEKFDTLLESYYAELCNTISLLGSDPKKLYPWDTFMNEVKEQFVFGMIFAMEIIPVSLLDESDTLDLDNISDENGVDIADVWILSHIKSQSGRLRLANIIVHAVQKGFL
ncbi:PREDICTED: uncharacterized protein LOC108545910 [Eufriesea mexicana]|uniref:uncharacterized protein LOC108545910 n=1 Tax=Eufriesea mexicana TaxID=516756 RepID=UPI00083BCC96|nr:PREDICTED: uncharacterized protein LOC108545910 [Eufriesea mexicana]